MELLPKDISESIVIHLRLGDVVTGNALHEQVKRPLSVLSNRYLKNVINELEADYFVSNNADIDSC